MSLKNMCIRAGALIIIDVPFKGHTFKLKVTPAQLCTIVEAGVEVIGIFTYAGKQVARGRGMLDGKKVQPMIHKLLDFDITSIDNYLDFTVEPEIDDLYDIPVPEPQTKVKNVVKSKKENKTPKPKIYDEPINDCSEYPIRGVSWNKRKNKYEAKATHKATKSRQFLGYYEPCDVHVANNAVRDFIAHGHDVYNEIMERYYTLYPKKRR